MRFSLMMLFIANSMSVYALEDFDRQQIEQRIKPIGQVRLEEKKAVVPEATPTKEEAKIEEVPGKATYEQYCHVCHRDGVAGAPKFRDVADWKPRMDKKNLDELIASSIKGLNAMPPKGTCMDCSDEDMKNAIQYMMPKA